MEQFGEYGECVGRGRVIRPQGIPENQKPTIMHDVVSSAAQLAEYTAVLRDEVYAKLDMYVGKDDGNKPTPMQKPAMPGLIGNTLQAMETARENIDFIRAALNRI
jgi:hypothetical protein